MRAADFRPLLLALGVCANLQFCRSEGQRHLDAALHHYDTLHVNHLKHTLPTGTTSTPHASSAHQLKREVEFYALEKKFHLHLVPHRGIFSKDFAAYVVDGSGRRTSHPVNLDEFYRGFLQDEETAIVVAHISEEGVLLASIKTSSEIYHIEPSENYIRTPHSFHMIAYRGSDVKRKSESKIDYVQTPLILEPDEDAEANSESSNHDAPEFHKSSYRSNHGDPDSKTGALPPHFRLKRQSTILRGDLGGPNCRMILVADYFFSQNSVTEASTVRILVTLVSAIDAQIYRPTQWIVGTGPDDTISELGLEIGSILVHTEPFTTTLAQAPTQYYNSADLSDKNPDAGDLLDAFNLGDWRGYCLAHLFTFRNFDSGLLGLANIASPRRGETGGICSGRFNLRGRLFNFNTGISTFNSDGNALVMEESRLVTGHELGHNWGSHHDPRECGDDFLMDEFAQDGSLATHMQFSSCSRRSIGLVLLTKGDCFSAPTALCGDFRVEGDEDCDAGPAGDMCCNNVTCTLRRPEAECSDSNEDCCEGCRAASSETVCRFVRNSSIDCTVSTFCDGVEFSCPSAQPAEVNSSCSGGLCVRNDSTNQTVCTPLCTVLNRTSCLCTGTEECLVCCQDDENNCMPAVIDDGMTFNLSNGAACSNGACLNGSCTDQFQDTITRLFNIIANLDINDLAQLVSENIVGCVLLFTAILWIPASCAIHFICDRGSSHDYTDWIPRRIRPMPHSREREREPLLDNEESPPTDKPEYVPEPVDDQPLPPSYSGRPAMDDPPSYSEKPPVEPAASSIDEPLTRTYI